jgi:glycoprotein endo-alpha-1,2-mannosidase
MLTSTSRATRRVALSAHVAVLLFFSTLLGQGQASDTSRQVLAIYYGWYGVPATNQQWRHWQGVDLAGERIQNSTNFPAEGAYDSHDRAILERQAAAAHTAGISGFIASWWGRGSFEDQGVPLLLEAAGRHGLVVSAYYEKVDGDDSTSRIRSAIADLRYLLARYGANKVWLRAAGSPVIFVYGRALHALKPSDWTEVIAQLRQNNPGGVVLIADSFSPDYVSVFDGASTYNVTGQTQHKTPAETRAWAHAAYPKMIAAARGKISTLTVIPGYDDRNTGRSPPRPITDRYGGETYRALWQEAIKANPDYVLITSWNEWHEGSEVEPSVEYGSRLLEDTEAFSHEFLNRRN